MKLERCIIISALLACVASVKAAAAVCAVDPVNGADSPGAAAYRTLTYALAQHGGDTTYSLAAGTYSAATGETFPITLSNLANVAIVGPKGQKAVFDAAGANTRVFLVESACDAIAFSNVTVTGASVVYDAAVTGSFTGAVTLRDSTNISFTDCEVSGNRATKNAGSNNPIYGAGMAIYQCDGVAFEGCLIAGNLLTYNNWGPCCGAGVGLNYSKNVAFSNCEFRENGSDGAGGQGGFAGAAVYSFAGLFANTYLVTFENCLFQGNSIATTGTGAQNGACIALSNKSGGGYPTARFTRCTFLENVGQPIYNTASSSSATECVFVGNSMPDGGRATTYTDCLWEEFDDVFGYHPASGDDPARTPAADWYVAPTGSDDNPGSDADHPFKTLTKAFSVLANNATLHVADGVYDAAGGETFPLKLSRLLNLAVVGGDGVPVIDAGQASRALGIFGCHGLSIANLALTGGKSPTGGHGGGALLQSCRGVLSNCAITNNQVVTAWSSSDVYGGGLYVLGNTSGIVLDGCLVADNDIGPTGGRQGFGGGLAAGAVESFAVSNCVIRNNGSSSAYMKNGGGIYANNAITKFRVFNTLFTGNRAVTSGAAVYTGSAGTMENCTVADNLVSVPLTGTLTLLDSICTGNAAEPASTVTLDHTMTTAPGFVGDSYLVGPDSEAIDAGSVTAASVGLGEPMTIRADGAYDVGMVDLGYHQVSTGPVVAITDLYVAPTGSDSSDGLDAAHPLRSITKALSLAQNGTAVHLAAGVYDVAHGETFPLTLAKPGLSLVCEDGVAFVDATDGDDCALEVSGAQGFTVRRVVFANARRVGLRGGGLDIRNSSGVIDSCAVTNCMVSIDDSSQTTTYGGGLYVLGSSLLMTNCAIVANGTGIIRSNNPRSHGGGLYVESGSMVELAACSIVSNFTANANFGVYGAAISSGGADTSLALRNCLVVGNRRQASTPAFSAIAALSGTVTIENCTIADNAASKGAVANSGEGFSDRATVSIVNSILHGNGAETNGTISVSYTLVDGGETDAESHVIAGDPRFRNPSRGDYGLRSDSPCVNAGLTASWMKAARDLAGNPRLRNGAVDLGCYECQSGGFFLMLR